jgi:hypothetical protein
VLIHQIRPDDLNYLPLGKSDRLPGDHFVDHDNNIRISIQDFETDTLNNIGYGARVDIGMDELPPPGDTTSDGTIGGIWPPPRGPRGRPQ